MDSRQQEEFDEAVQLAFDYVVSALANGRTARDIAASLIQEGMPDDLALALVDRIINSCTRCRKFLPVTGVSYVRQTGLLILNMRENVEATLCEACNRRVFWSCMVHCVFLGWWGIKSFFLNIAAIIGNYNAYREARVKLRKGTL